MMSTSGKFIEQARTRTSSSPGPASGAGTSSNRSVSGPPRSWERSAFTASIVVCGGGFLAHLVSRHAGRELDQPEGTHVARTLEHGEVGDDHVDEILAGQRQRAFGNELGAAVLRHMLHHDDDLLDAGDKVHRPAHALDHLARNHPVGEVAFLADLHAAEYRQVDVSAADHG